jgi:hypothetical protein
MSLCRGTILDLLALLIVGLVVTGSGRAADDNSGPVPLSVSKLNLIENNLIQTLESNVPRWQASAAQVIRDLKARVPEYGFARSIIPLMRILKDDSQESGLRQMAALTLHEIGSARGAFAIEREAKFCGDAQLKRLCTWLAYSRVEKSRAAIAPPSGAEQLITETR